MTADLTGLPFLAQPGAEVRDAIILPAHKGLRRGSLFNLHWDQIDLDHGVMRIPRTKSGRLLSVPLNVTAYDTLKVLHAARKPGSPDVFPHRV